jgi:hypothetical protein
LSKIKLAPLSNSLGMLLMKSSIILHVLMIQLN